MAEDADGRVLGGRYRLEHLVARGGMAEVWAGDDTVLERRVAVKILHAALAADDTVRERFRREARAAARVTHPGIVSVYDTGDDEDAVFIVMEHVDGPTLRRLLDDGPLATERALALADQVADALDFAHRQGLVHRDVKPGNVLVGRGDHALVVDFGIATAVGGGGDLTRAGTVVGTARYLAPEQVTGGSVDARTDVYGLGLVVYEMLAGEPAFGGETDLGSALARVTSEAPSLAARAAIPRHVVAAVDRALARDPEERWASAADFRDALAGRSPAERVPDPSEDVTDETPIVAAPADVTEVARTSAEPRTAVIATDLPGDGDDAGAATDGTVRRRWLALGAAGVLAVGIGVTVALLLGNDGDDAAPRADASELTIVGGADFDPQGDGAENPETVEEAFDGDPATGWRTQVYTTPDLGGLKDGVGLRLDLDGPAEVAALLVDTDLAGWSAEVYIADEPGEAIEDWGVPRGTGSDLGTSARLDLEPDSRGTSVLLWVTRVPGGGRLVVHDVTLLR